MSAPVSAPRAESRGERPVPAASAVARVVLLGASGYSGQEFARLALRHPGIDLVALVSREHAGRPAADLLPGIVADGRPLPPVVDVESAVGSVRSGAADTVVACLPHGTWREMASRHPGLHGDGNGDGGPRVVDLSSDFRDGSGGYVYGLPEAFRAGIPHARRIANPGCYPTATALALLPAAERGWIGGPVMVSAISGVSGAGRGANPRMSFVEREGGAELYKAGSVHQHVPEMERCLGRVAGGAIEVGFAPQIVPMARGILAVVNAPLAEPVSPGEARALWTARYEGEPFVRVLPADTWPETRLVRGSNRCDVAVTTLHGGRTLMVASAIDNLVKGAAGQAIQNLNLLLGLPETTGLPVDGTPW